MVLANRIKQCRKRKNMTQEELGNLIDVSKVSICQWEKGTKTPSTKNLILLSKVFNIELEYLIGNDNYVVASNDEKYEMAMAKEEIDIIRELKRHDKLYKELLENPKRAVERIEKSIYKHM